MRRLARIAAAVGLVLPLLATGAAGAGGPAPEPHVTRLEVAPGSRLWLEGTTNVNTWSCRGERIGGRIEVDAPSGLVVELLERANQVASAEVTQAAAGLPNPRLRLIVPVAALACGNRAMERDLRRALRAGSHPSIVYDYERVTELAVAGGGSGGRRFDLGVAGDLALAGTEREVRTTVAGERLAPGRFRITGTLDLKMTDFGIEPPVALMGLIRAGDRLRVRFDLRLALAEECRAALGALPAGAPR
jgi:polyisoprenoid-binding protein YceI